MVVVVVVGTSQRSAIPLCAVQRRSAAARRATLLCVYLVGKTDVLSLINIDSLRRAAPRSGAAQRNAAPRAAYLRLITFVVARHCISRRTSAPPFCAWKAGDNLVSILALVAAVVRTGQTDRQTNMHTYMHTHTHTHRHTQMYIRTNVHTYTLTQ